MSAFEMNDVFGNLFGRKPVSEMSEEEAIINEKNNYNDCVVESVKEVDLNSDSKETNGWDSI